MCVSFVTKLTTEMDKMTKMDGVGSWVVKIAALSPEFSISEKKEKLEQDLGPVEAPLAAPLAASEDTPGLSANGPQRGSYFIWVPGVEEVDDVRVQSARDVPKSEKVKENPSFDICEHTIESLESSLKWRSIQKTLRWLNRVLSSNHTKMELCRKRKVHKPRRSFMNRKTTNYEFFESKKSFSKRKKTKQGRRLSDVKASRFPWGERGIKRKRKYKHKSWRNLSKNETRKLKSKWKGPRYERKNFPDSSPPHLDPATILKPNSVLFKRMFLKKAKSRSDCLDVNSNSESTAVNTERNCVETKNSKTSQGSERKSSDTEEGWSGEQKSRGHDPNRKLPKQKAKPWPHFVYHRVSSNFLHPELAGHSHRQSAYVAISVATSSRPGTHLEDRYSHSSCEVRYSSGKGCH